MNQESGQVRMRVLRGSVDGNPSIRIIGPFDAISDTALEYVREIVDEGAVELVLDLSQTTYMTSQGIACTIKALKLVQAANCRLCVRGASKDMIDLFRLARIDKNIRLIE